MNILFLSYSYISKFFCKVANELSAKERIRSGKNNKNDIKINKFYYLTLTDIDKKYLIKNSPDNTEIINIYKDFNINKIEHYELDTIKKYEKLYGIPNLWCYTIYEEKFRNLSENRTFDVICYHLKFFENLFKKKKVDLVISLWEDCFNFVSISMKNVSYYYKIYNFYIGSTPLHDRFIIINNMLYISENLKKEYNKLKNVKLNEEQLKISNEIISRYRKKRIKSTGFVADQLIPHYYNILNIFKKTKNYFLYGLKNEEILKIILKKSVFAKGLRTLFIKIFFPKLFVSPNYGDKFFLYPLTTQGVLNDFSTGRYYNEKYIIEYIINYLPPEYYLYVREHPGILGLKPIKYYREIIKNKRIKLIKPNINSFDLLEKCSGVILLTGGLGWEAFVLKKPVINFYYTYYNLVKDGIYYVDNIHNFRNTLNKMINEYVPDEEDILEFCYALYKCSYPGIVLPPSVNPNSLLDKNIKNVADALITEYNKIIKSKLIKEKSNG